MTDPSEWIRDLIPPEDVEQLQSKAERIVEGHNTFYEMTLMMYEEDMIKTVRMLDGMRNGSKEAWLLAINLILALVNTMEEALGESGINPYDEQ